MMPHSMFFSIPVDRLMLLAISLTFALTLVCRIMIHTVNARMPAVVVTAVMAAAMPMRHSWYGKTA